MRPDWDEYFLSLVDAVSSRATCDRGKSGCIIVKDKRIICSGYVGAPPGLDHCDEAGHLLKEMIDEKGEVKKHCVRTIHAEQNAICQAAKHGISLQGSTLYCSMEPCRVCAMLIVSVGIQRVIAKKRYHAGQDSRDLLRSAHVELKVIENKTESYLNQ